MIRYFLLTLLTLPLAIGCSNSAGQQTASPEGTNSTAPEKPDAGKGAEETPATGTQIALTPENTTLEFVGSHIVETPPDPMARHGKFKKFSGTATLAEGKLSAVSVEIETASLDTSIEKLNNHLLGPDFFDVRENPKASFVSTKIETSEDGKTTITGVLTLLKETKSISFPATVTTGEKFDLSAELTIDRSEFGMDYGVDKVEKDVVLKINVSGK